MTTQPFSLPETASGRDPRAEPRAMTPAAAPPHAAGMLWFAGWLFTIGFAKLVWWKVLLGLLVWPYFLGTTIR
jgi:hypothetical protein